ncbi:MAG: alkyl sulfatase C-terminal domain-containing protein [Monoglobales bacterium]
MKFEQAFKKFKDKFTDVDISGLDDLALQITISDEDCGGTFYTELKSGVLSIEPYDYKDNNAIVDVSRAALNNLIDGKITVEQAIDSGELTVKGELDKLHGLIDAVSASIQKAKQEKAAKAAKETAEKAKKEAAEKAAKEKAEKEAAEKAAKEKAEKEAAEKASKAKAVKATKPAATKAPAKRTASKATK